MSSSTLSAVASVTTAGGVTLLAANGLRKSVTIENSDANRLHIRFGSGTVSATSYSVSLAQYGSLILPGYTGEITGIWAADGSGSAHVTEIF